MNNLINAAVKEVEREILETIKRLGERYKMDENEAKEYINKCKNEKRENRGRPKKEKNEEKVERGVRGRPPKEEKKETSHVGDDLISRLLLEAKKKEINK